MAHSVATGVIGGGYGPYSVSLSSSPASLSYLIFNILIAPASTILANWDRVQVVSLRAGIRKRP